MITQTLIAVLISFGFFQFADSRIASWSPISAQENPQAGERHSPFRYVITGNQITEGRLVPSGQRVRLRGVDVLLDKDCFSEATLKQLVGLLSKRFPDPVDLRVDIHTDLEDVPTPEESDYVPSSGSRIDSRESKYAWASYKRDRDGELLDYNTMKPGAAVKTIRLSTKGQ